MISAWGPGLPQRQARIPGEKEEAVGQAGEAGGDGGGGRPAGAGDEQLGETEGGEAKRQAVSEPPSERAELPEEADQRHQLQRVQLC